MIRPRWVFTEDATSWDWAARPPRICRLTRMQSNLRPELEGEAMDSEQALDAAVRLEVYRFFVDQGRPPVPAEVAETLATDQASVEDSLVPACDGYVGSLDLPSERSASPLGDARVDVGEPFPFVIEKLDRTVNDIAEK
jgi:hypothetical protein